ncbi:MAG: helix-turn-helix domain-containing protein [Deltaproteobacteria bacterium]
MAANRSPLKSAVAIELARRGWTQRDLARELGVPDTSLSDWLLEAHPGPEDLIGRIERSLGLKEGSLLRQARGQP